jgi:hypothetical protein
VVYDDVQYDKHGWRNRNRIKTPHGVQWLTVPVLTRGQNKPANKDVLIDNTTNWRRKHLAAIQGNYAKAAFFREYIGCLEEIYSREWKLLMDLDVTLVVRLAEWLGLKREIRYASDLGIPGAGTERLVAICRALGAARFYEGAAGKDYMQESLFADAGIALEYQDYRHPVYGQLHGDFVPYLSAIDVLFNHGPESLRIIKGGEK